MAGRCCAAVRTRDGRGSWCAARRGPGGRRGAGGRPWSPHRSCPRPRRRPPGPACSRSPERLTSAARAPASARAAPATSTRVRTSWPLRGRRSSRRMRARSASTSYQSGGAGEYVVLDGADGRDYFFAHCLRRSTVVGAGRGGERRSGAVPGRRDRRHERRATPALRDLAGRLARPRRRADRPAPGAARLVGPLGVPGGRARRRYPPRPRRDSSVGRAHD